MPVILCPDLQPLLDAELAAGNRVGSTGPAVGNPEGTINTPWPPRSLERLATTVPACHLCSFPIPRTRARASDRFVLHPSVSLASSRFA